MSKFGLIATDVYTLSTHNQDITVGSINGALAIQVGDIHILNITQLYAYPFGILVQKDELVYLIDSATGNVSVSDVSDWKTILFWQVSLLDRDKLNSDKSQVIKMITLIGRLRRLGLEKGTMPLLVSDTGATGFLFSVGADYYLLNNNLVYSVSFTAYKDLGVNYLTEVVKYQSPIGNLD